MSEAALKNVEPLKKKAPAKAQEVEFDGGGLDFLGTGILSFLVTFATFGLCAPWGICMYYKWETEHTIVNGKRMRFTGSAWGLFGLWIKWWAFSVLTLGIYAFWMYPDLRRWIAKNTSFN